MESEDRLGLLKDEYLMLQGFYEDIDERCITIKGWSITVGLAVMGGGFVYSGWLFLGALVSGILFWYLEGYWRGLSFFFARRILEIEKALREETWKTLEPLQVYFSWSRSFDAHGGQTWRYMRRLPNMVPHLVLGLAGMGLFVLEYLGLF